MIFNLKSNWPSLLEASATDHHVDLQTSPETVTSHDTFLCPKCDYKCQSLYHLHLHIKGHYDCNQCGSKKLCGENAVDKTTSLWQSAIVPTTCNSLGGVSRLGAAQVDKSSILLLKDNRRTPQS